MSERTIDVSSLAGTALRSDYKDSTDPAYVGPGHWNIIHRLAWLARTMEKQKEFIYVMNQGCGGFPCTVCRGHCTDYISNHPMEEYLGVYVDIKGEKLMVGLFVWTVIFHNAVNARLNKPIMSWNTACDIYAESSSNVCSTACHDAAGDSKTVEKKQEYVPFTKSAASKFTPTVGSGFKLIVGSKK